MTNDRHQKRLRRLRAYRNLRRLLSGAGLLMVGFGLYEAVLLFADYRTHETTNDAQVEQYLSPVNVRVAGYVERVCFREHQFVHRGDTLLVIDDSEYRIRLAEAEAALLDARSGKRVTEGTLETSVLNTRVFNASIEQAQVRIAKLERDYQRYSNLLERNAATVEQVDRTKTELDAARAGLEALEKQLASAHSGVNEVRRRQEGAEAAILRAQAAVDMARLNLSYTVVTAPCDGWLGRRALEEGQLVSAGQNITYLIPDTRKWIIANYRETQVRNLRVGQEVEIRVDAFKGRTFRGRVTAIANATGSKYSLVPADNSTGNFIKIQQRIPVRIDFDGLSDEDNRLLAAGMMAEVRARIRR